MHLVNSSDSSSKFSGKLNKNLSSIYINDAFKKGAEQFK